MSVTGEDVYDVLEWLEQVFPDRIQFPDKNALANGYIGSERHAARMRQEDQDYNDAVSRDEYMKGTNH